MILLPRLTPLRKRPFVILISALLLITESLFLPNILIAGTGGVPGGCAFARQVNGVTTYSACSGTNSPMWYPVGDNPTYNQGDLPCGTFGNQNCGSIVGDPLNE